MNLKGSSLVFSLIVLSLLLVSAISVATVSITARKSSLSSKNSNVAFQVADSAAELMLKQIYKGSVANTPNDLASNLGTNCSASQIGASVGMGTYVAILYTADGSSISCSDSSWRDNISKVKFQGKYQSTMRAIEVGITPPCNPVTDTDGNKYDVILIGTQCWMAQNLNVGTMLASGSTLPSNNGTAEKWCYDNSNANCNSDGGLYQWDEAMKYSSTSGARGICPTGWHIPTHDEYTTLERSVCTSGTCVTDFPLDTSTSGLRGTNEGSKLSLYTSGGNNFSGFSGILAGDRYADGSFANRSALAFLWSSTPSGGTAWGRHLFSSYTTVNRGAVAKALGFSVRCLKD